MKKNTATLINSLIISRKLQYIDPLDLSRFWVANIIASQNARESKKLLQKAQNLNFLLFSCVVHIQKLAYVSGSCDYLEYNFRQE